MFSLKLLRSCAAISRHQMARPFSATCTSNQQQQLRFDGRTAIVTGAARGIGKQHALLLASRGANLVLNDFGGSRSGEQAHCAEEQAAIDQVASEISKLVPGSKVFINRDSVCDPAGVRRLVELALEKFGQIDVLINNAGILRDKSFAKMSLDDWEQVCNVHLKGSFLVSHSCWPIMKRQKYGKIVMTSSTSALYGNFGQANYSAAKMALIGLSNTLAIEGKSSNIHCNVLVPMAASRMTQDIIPEPLALKLKPEFVSPLAVWLCHEACRETGSIWEAAGQWYGRHRLLRSAGKYLPDICKQDQSLETISANWQSIASFDNPSLEVDSFASHLNELLKSLKLDD